MFPFISSRALFVRQFIVWRKNWKNFLLLRVLEPAIMLYAMGFGLGLAFDRVNGVDYLHYVVPGIMCSACMMASIFDGIYGSLTRHIYQGLWGSQLATGVSLFQLLTLEAVWMGAKAMVAALLVLVVGVSFGGVSDVLLCVEAVPFLLLGGLVFAALGQLLSSRASAYMDIDYVWPLIITPMFMFSGVFIPIASFPEWLQSLMYVSPLFYVVELVRGTLLGTLTLPMILLYVPILLGMFVCFQQVSFYIYKRRIFA